MSKEYSALTAVKGFLLANMDATPEASLVADQFSFDYPDVDKMKYPVMFFIYPEDGTLDRLTMDSILEHFNIKLTLIVRSSTTHKETTDQLEAEFEYFAAAINAIISDPTMGGSFSDTIMSSFNVFPAVAGLTNAVGIEVPLSLEFERVPLLTPGDTLPGDYVIPVGG